MVFDVRRFDRIIPALLVVLIAAGLIAFSLHFAVGHSDAHGGATDCPYCSLFASALVCAAALAVAAVSRGAFASRHSPNPIQAYSGASFLRRGPPIAGAPAKTWTVALHCAPPF